MLLVRTNLSAMAGFSSFARSRPEALFAAIAVVATVLRVAALVFADADLGPDEAQYWVWSRDLDFGYFSKPPLIAWTIAATTALFGDAEWAVRLAAPFFHLGGAAFLFLLARKLFDPWVAFWSGLGWLLMPGVSFSSALITTDAPLLFFWCGALYFFFDLALARPEGRSAFGPALCLGLMIGLGFLAKYAMTFFVGGALLALICAPALRRNLKPLDALIVSATAGALIAPNIFWNAANKFQTFAHTAANAKWGGDLFHPDRLLEFLGAQIGVVGPIAFGLLVWGLLTLRKRLGSAQPERQIALIAFAAPALLIVSAQALLSRAHANWAGVAYPAATILIALWAVRARLAPVLAASTAFHGLAALVFMAIFTNFALADRVGLTNAVKRLRSWEATGAEIRKAAAGYDAIVVDDRELMASLLYYARGGPPIVSWNSNHKIDHHFEAFMGFETVEAPRALFVSESPSLIALENRYEAAAPAGEFSIDLHGGKTRALYMYAVDRLRP